MAIGMGNLVQARLLLHGRGGIEIGEEDGNEPALPAGDKLTPHPL